MDVAEFENDDVDSDDSENDEKALELEVNNLENKIAFNEFSYQSYLDLIKALKALADLDRLRNARKRMADRFPLSPDLWIDWLHDEINLATSINEKNQIVELFEKAVKDYLSIDIWLEYALYIISLEKEKNSNDSSAVRKVFENALTAGGLHVTQGFYLWNAYIDYEKSLLTKIHENTDEYKKQLKIVANLYKRQISCPLKTLNETYNAFKDWINEISKTYQDQILDHKLVDDLYRQTEKKLNKIMPFEEKWQSNSENLLDILKEYLEHEKSKEGFPSRVQCLYERILCDNCLNEEIWLEYIQYVDNVLHNGEAVLNICQRAIRNCPWCCKLYQLYIMCLEKYKMPLKNIAGVIEDAFASGLQIASDFRDVWMTYLEYLRRRFDLSENKEEEEKRLDDLRANFARAVEYVEQMPDCDPEFTITQYWARIEAIYCKNMEKSRELWNAILMKDSCRTADMWIEYIFLERAYGDSKHIRKLFPRAFQGTKDNPEKIGKVWLNYERDEGTLESYENCLKKINARLKELEERRKREEEKMIEAANALSQEPREYSKKKYKKKFETTKEFKEKEEYFKKEDNEKHAGSKRKADYSTEDCSPKKKSKETKKEDSAVKVNEVNQEDFVNKLLNESKKQHGETYVHEFAKDNRTVFVSNLDFATEEEPIRNAFSECGNITDLRLVRDYKGRSKGYCYVEFEKSKEAQRALQKDRELINGRPMFVSKCDPDKETRAKGFKYSSGMEKNKLFIRGLPFTTTEDDLRTLFSKYGTLKDVRLVTYRNGHSKGLAYVEFSEEASAAQALLSADGITIEGKQISVAISNPPERKVEEPLWKQPSLSLGGGLKMTGPRGKSKTQISFLPRSLTLNKPGPATESMANLTLSSPPLANDTKKLNNADFRKLLG